VSRVARAASGTAVFSAQMILRLVTPLIVSRLLVRVNGRDVLGAYSIILEIVGYVMLLDLGIGTAIAREVAQMPQSPKGAGQFNTVAVTAVRFLTVSGVVVGLITFAIQESFPFWLRTTPEALAGSRTALSILACWMVPRFPLAFFQLLLYARQEIARYAFSEFVGEVIRTIASILLVIGRFGLPGLATATVIGQAISLLLCVYWSRHHIRSVNWLQAGSRRILMKLIGISYPLGVMSLCDRVALFSQNTIVAYLFDTKTAAAFYATRTPGFYAASILWRFADAIFPGINELYGANLRDPLRSAYTRIIGYTMGMAVWLAVGIWAFNRELVSLWLGPAFYLGRPITVALAILILSATFKNISAKFAVMEGRIRTLMWILVGEALVGVTLSLLLGRLWGAAGVLWAGVFASTVTVLYLSVRPAAIMQAPVLHLLRQALVVSLRASVVGVIACVGYVAIRHSIVDPYVALRALILVLVAGGSGFILFGLSPHDRGSLLRMMRLRKLDI
jgi:O-antigen/teichoic acid export membrane protein